MKTPLRIAVGSDHAGFSRKQFLRDALLGLGFKVVDLGCHREERCDYPDFAKKVAESVAKGRCDKGLLICGTGIGMSIAANKVQGIRAAVAWNSFTAQVASEHNWSNVLCLPGRLLSHSQALRILKVWLRTAPAPGRHERRVRKIEKLEQGRCAG